MQIGGYRINLDALLAQLVYRWPLQSLVVLLLVLALAGLGTGLIAPFWKQLATLTISAAPGATVEVDGRAWPRRLYAGQHTVLVCSKAHGNCCCCWTEKGRAPMNVALCEQEWERRKIRNKVHLTFTGCLGPCAVGNNALLQLFGRSIWFKDLNGDEYIPAIFE